jgi:hypothetical protein
MEHKKLIIPYLPEWKMTLIVLRCMSVQGKVIFMLIHTPTIRKLVKHVTHDIY